MRRIVAKFVNRLLTNDQKKHRVNACTELKYLFFKDDRCIRAKRDHFEDDSGHKPKN